MRHSLFVRSSYQSLAQRVQQNHGPAGKARGIDGTDVEPIFPEGKIKDIAEYCETDVVNTYAGLVEI